MKDVENFLVRRIKKIESGVAVEVVPPHGFTGVTGVSGVCPQGATTTMETTSMARSHSATQKTSSGNSLAAETLLLTSLVSDPQRLIDQLIQTIDSFTDISILSNSCFSEARSF